MYRFAPLYNFLRAQFSRCFTGRQTKSIAWTSLDTLLEQGVELVDLGSDRKVNSVAGKVNDETTLDGRVDLLNDAERLAITLGGDLRTLECRLDARDHRLVQRSSRGDGDLNLTTV